MGSENIDGDMIVMLGTGTPNPMPDRSGPSTAIIVNGTAYLVDCGPGVVRRATSAYNSGITSLKARNLGHLFITHLHSDHTVGLPDLIFTPWVMERNRKLKIFGPPGVKDMVKHIHKAYEKDIHIRIHGLEKGNRVGYKADVKEVKEGPIFKDENVRVSAIPTTHGMWDHSFGYRFESEKNTIVISGDCRPTPESASRYGKCDVLIHEVYSHKGFKNRSEKWKAYHAASHTSSKELALIAGEVNPKLLILYHQLLWGTTPEDIIDDIRERYDGEIAFANDLDVFRL